MEFWILWFIGIAITIGTRIAINILTREDEDIYARRKFIQIVMHILVIICIILVGGIIVGKWIGNFSTLTVESFSFTLDDILVLLFIVILTILGALITYLVGTVILGLYHFDNPLSQICFFVVFVVSIICWSIPICRYNRNIETITENVVSQKQEHQLLYFCNVPVQKISGDVSGSAILGTGSVSGDISTEDELPYWYLNEYGEGEYDSVLADSSKIVFIEDNKTPYVVIVSYCKQTTTKNHNNGKEKVRIDEEWREYHFYLPKSIMQYNLG